MALTFKLNQTSSADVPGVGFYAQISNDALGTYWDEARQALAPLSNSQPNIAFTETTAGHWEVTRDLSGVPDGFYTVKIFESPHNVSAAENKHLFLIGGETSGTYALNQIALSHNHGGADTLAYKTPDGAAIVGAFVRVYTNTDWQAQSLANPVGITLTDKDGRWLDPIFVTAGNTYFIQFHLAQKYGPDVVSVVL